MSFMEAVGNGTKARYVSETVILHFITIYFLCEFADIFFSPQSSVQFFFLFNNIKRADGDHGKKTWVMFTLSFPAHPAELNFATKSYIDTLKYEYIVRKFCLISSDFFLISSALVAVVEDQYGDEDD